MNGAMVLPGEIVQDKKKAKTKKCSIDGCSFASSTNYHMKYHMIAQHGIGIKIKCPYCDYTCANNSMLNSHMKSHSDARPYVCDTCGLSYKFSTILRKHLIKFPEHTSSSLVKKSENKSAEKKSKKGKLIVNIPSIVNVKVEVCTEEPQGSNAGSPIHRQVKIEPACEAGAQRPSNLGAILAALKDKLVACGANATPGEKHSYELGCQDGPLDLSIRNGDFACHENRRSRKRVPIKLDAMEVGDDENLI